MENNRLVFTIHPDSDRKMNQKAATRIVEGFVRERMSQAG